jgi:hypothetical protein
MRTLRRGSWTVGGIALCCSVACGPSAPPPPPPETSTGHEEPPPPPPPPAASLHVVHASPDPGLSSFSIGIDGDPPIVRDLAAGTASGAIEVASGAHALHLLGVASVETGEAAEVMATDVTFAEGAHPIVLVYGEPSAEPPLTVTVLDEDATGTGTRARIVHGLVGVPAIDVCNGTTPIAAALEPGAISPATPIGEGAAAIAVHTASDDPCHGRSLGVAHTTLAAGTAYVITISGHNARRGRPTASLVVCSEGNSVTCESAALGAR